MNKNAWRKKFDLPPGYIQEALWSELPVKKPQPHSVARYMLGSVMIVLLFSAFLTQQIYLYMYSRDIAALEQTLSSLHRENEALRLEYTQAENLTYVEQVATGKLGMVKPYSVLYLSPIEFASR